MRNFSKAIRVTVIISLVLGFVALGTGYAARRSSNYSLSPADAFKNVMPKADKFNKIELAAGRSKAGVAITSVEKALKGNALVGYCLSVSSQGYSGPINFVVGITKDGKVSAIRILNHSETPRFSAQLTEPVFYEQFNNRGKFPLTVVKGKASGANQISAISGATITSQAVTDGVNVAVNYWKNNLQEGH